MVHPHAFSHIGITVPDIKKAVEWYAAVLGFTLIAGPHDMHVDDGPDGASSRDIFGDRLGNYRQAAMVGADGLGLEMFEFVEPEVESRADNLEYWKIGIFHYCVVDSDIEGMARRIDEAGGKQRSGIWPQDPDKPRCCYCEDPWGNIIEINTHPYVETMLALSSDQ